ncbi:MAG: hypothetical protein NVS3B10_06750 [Polyangiales bacterium]
MRVAIGSVAPALLLALASVLVARSASAESTCITAYEQTQTLRKDGKPLASRAQAAICSRESCPALLTKDCTKWLAELDAIIPTVVFDPRTSGAFRSDVRVKIDGATLDDKNAGRPVPLEPGSHTFVFEADGAAPVEQTLVLKEGEKNKKVSVTLASASSPSADAKTSERPVPIGVWIFGGATIVALATSAALAIDGLGKKSDLDRCKPHCAGSDVDAMSASFTLADVALGAGLMAGAAGVYLFLTRPRADPSAAPAAASAGARTTPFATPLPGGGAAGVAVVF